MSIIASACKDIKFHQWLDGVHQQSYKPNNHGGHIQSISWGKDGSWVVVVPESGPTEIISVKENIKLLQTIQDVYRPTCASFHTTTKKLVGIGTMCGQVMIYDIKGKNIKKRFPRAQSKICSLHYNSKDTHIAATCNNGDILLLSNLVGNISTIYKVPHATSVSSANFHRLKRNLFAAGTDVGLIATWDINSNYMLCNLQAHQAPVSSIAFSPLRADLLVTGGLDRKCTFYDFNAMKFVANIEVNNAITSLDFSHCGIFIGIGFQNGNIAIYDIRRNFENPLSVFEAHAGGGTRHLLFQKVLSSSARNNSIFDITVGETPYLGQVDGGHSSNNASAFDSVEIVGSNDSNLQVGDMQISKPSQEYGDSFMLALGLNESNHSESLKIDATADYRVSDTYKKVGDASKCTTIYQRSNGQRNSLFVSKTVNMKTSSTPKYPDSEIPDAAESPILSTNQTSSSHYQSHNTNLPCDTQDAIQHIIKDFVQKEVRDVVRQEVRNIVHEELKTQTEVLRASMKSNSLDMLHHLRRHFLDLQMSIVKEFVNLETLVVKRTSLPPEVNYNELILNHNNALQHELNLKENIAQRDECPSRK